MTAMTAVDRLRRLLAIIPWVVENDGPLVDEVVERFDYPRKELLRDLGEILFFVGVHPFTPDCLVEVWLTEERVWIRYADWFRRPLRLPTPGNSSEDAEFGPLERALAKLAMIAKGSDRTVEIRLGGTGGLLATVHAAVSSREALRIDYHSFHRDVMGTRIVEPHRYYADKGFWYVVGHCRSAKAERVFRLDRIRKVEGTGERFSVANHAQESPEGIPVDGRLPEVVLELDPLARWVLDEYPHISVEDTRDDRVRVRLPVASERWLERLLLRLGPAATVVQEADGLRNDVRTAAALRVLERYRT